MSKLLTSIQQPEDSALTESNRVGIFGEELAAKFLARNNYRIVAANYKVPIGRNRRGVSVSGEIDIIALENQTVCFVEVKTRSSDEFASPLAAVNLRKQRQITRTARVYRQIFNVGHLNYRYDVVSIVLGSPPKIELFRNFWTEDKFRKKSWNDEIW